MTAFELWVKLHNALMSGELKPDMPVEVVVGQTTEPSERVKVVMVNINSDYFTLLTDRG